MKQWNGWKWSAEEEKLRATAATGVNDTADALAKAGTKIVIWSSKTVRTVRMVCVTNKLSPIIGWASRDQEVQTAVLFEERATSNKQPYKRVVKDAKRLSKFLKLKPK